MSACLRNASGSLSIFLPELLDGMRCTGYPSFKGTVMDGAQLANLVGGLEQNGLLQHSHLLTGYIGSASFLAEIVHVYEKLKAVNPDLRYGASRMRRSRAPHEIRAKESPVVPSESHIAQEHGGSDRAAARSPRCIPHLDLRVPLHTD